MEQFIRRLVTGRLGHLNNFFKNIHRAWTQLRSNCFELHYEKNLRPRVISLAFAKKKLAPKATSL